MRYIYIIYATNGKMGIHRLGGFPPQLLKRENCALAESHELQARDGFWLLICAHDGAEALRRISEREYRLTAIESAHQYRLGRIELPEYIKRIYKQGYSK